MNFRILTNAVNDKKVRINFDLIVVYEEYNKGTGLYTVDGEMWAVKETPEKIDELLGLDNSNYKKDAYYKKIIKEEGRIAAIKKHRSRTGLDLKESRDYIDILIPLEDEQK